MRRRRGAGGRRKERVKRRKKTRRTGELVLRYRSKNKKINKILKCSGGPIGRGKGIVVR